MLTTTGMEKIHKSMTSYVKALSKRNEGEDREKTLPVGRLGSTMIAHGEDFEDNSEYGQCLIGRAYLSLPYKDATDDNI